MGVLYSNNVPVGAERPPASKIKGRKGANEISGPPRSAPNPGVCFMCRWPDNYFKRREKMLEKTFAQIEEHVKGLLRDYKEHISQALDKLPESDEGKITPLTCSFKTQIEPKGGSTFKVCTTLTFTKEKITDSASAEVDEKQEELFKDKEKK